MLTTRYIKSNSLVDVALNVLYDFGVDRLNKQTIKELEAENARLRKQVDYLTYVLNREEIEPTPFDKIFWPNLKKW